MNINKIFDGVTNYLGLGNNNQTRTNMQTQTFVPQTAVDGWLNNLYKQTEGNNTAPFALNLQQTQQEPEPTAAESNYFIRLYNAEKDGKAKEAKPRLPDSLLSEPDPKAAVDKHLQRTVERYYHFYKDIDNLTTPQLDGKNPPLKTADDITKLKTERDALSKAWTDDFQKLYDKASKEVEKDAKKTPMSADEVRTKATGIAVERWNSKILFSKAEAEENTKADKGLTLFVKSKEDVSEVELNDVSQGQTGDCFLLAGIGAIAKRHPESLRDIIKDNGDGTYNVQLYNLGVTGTTFEQTFEKVNGKLIGEGHAKYGDTAKVDGKEQKEAWTVLIEKAYIQGNIGSYKDAGRGGSVREVMTALTGRQAETKLNATLSTEDFSKLLKSNRAIVLSTPDKTSEIANGKMRGKFQDYKLVENHAYVLQEVKTNEKGKEIAVLYNPWGTQHAEVPVEEARELFKYVTTEGSDAK